MDETRFFANKFGEYDGESDLLGTDDKLIGMVSTDIETFISSKLEEIHHYYTQLIDHKLDTSHNSSVYTGTCGYILLTQKIIPEDNPVSNYLSAITEPLLKKARFSRKRITFLCGDAGPIALCAIHYHRIGDQEGTKAYIDLLIEYAKISSKHKIDNEVLYGRAGYLYALLLVKKQIRMDIIADDIIEQIVNQLINAGLKGSRNNSKLPLYYEWHEKEYIGAAHGYIGILYMLLQAKILCPDIEFGKNDAWTLDELIMTCLDNLLSERFPSGNMKSSVGAQNDRLIHWCHGASGAVHLYALAYKVFKKPAYLSAAEGFADNVWSRGLLRKGYGICHGVAGNGYTHLCMFQLTGKKTYLWRAIKFAEWCLSYGQHDCRTPDHPYSLFEGIFGTLYFLHDMLHPKEAMFPAFQLVSYS